jgi:hypothetical protein
MRSAAGSEFLERRPGFLLDLRAEAFAELAIDRREQLICLPRPAPDAERSGTGLGQPFGEYGLYIRKPASAVVSFGGSGVDDYHHAIWDAAADLELSHRPGGGDEHDVRINVNMTHGNQLNISNWAVVAVRPTPRLITGRLLPTDAQAVFDWRDPTSIRLSPTGTVKSARYKWPKHRSDYRPPLKVNRDSRNRHRCFKRNQRTRGDRVLC